MNTIDLRQIVETALDAFPLAPDGMDPAGDFAHRMLNKELLRLQKEGVVLDSAKTLAWQEKLDAVLDDLRRTYKPRNLPEPPSAPQVPPPRRPEIDFEALVADAFSAPYDGTPERRAVLAQRARGTIESALSSGEWSWLERIQIRRAAERAIADELARLEAP